MTTFIAASRVVKAVGVSYQGSPANLLDTDPGTTADIDLTGSGQADWFILDTGAETSVGSVTLVNVTGSGNSFGVWVSDTPNTEPNQGDVGHLATPNPMPSAAGATWTFTAPAAGKTGRYVLVRQFELGSSAGSVVIGGATYALSTSLPAGAAPRNLVVSVIYS